jgi:tRNA(Ile)-lysidine synthase
MPGTSREPPWLLWAGLAVSEKRHIVQAVVWRLRPDLRDVTFSHVERAIQVADRGTVGTSATLPGGLALRVGYVTLSIGPAAAAFELLPGQDAPALPGNTSGRVFLPGETVRLRFGGWQFEAGPLDPGADPAAIHADPLAVVLAVPPGAWLKLRPRVPGDRFQPRGMGGRSQKLGDTLINMKVPTGWRDRVPLLTVDDGVAWFVAPTASGLRERVAEPFAVPDDAGHLNDTVRIVARWRPLDESME